MKSQTEEIRKIVSLLLCCVFLTISTPVKSQPMQPHTYTSKAHVSGWLMSEKLDGVRGYWDGKQLFSKNGFPLFPPDEFIRDLPPFAIEGEIWGGRGKFEATVSITKKQFPHAGWRQLKFAIFDVPNVEGPFTKRITQAEDWFTKHPSSSAFVIQQTLVRDRDHLLKELQRIEKLGGEGLIVRDPEGLYISGRSVKILKVKSYQDQEAKVVAHLPGKGRNKGRLGALLVELEDGTRFKIGSGFSDDERKVPPSLGAMITFKYYGTYASGIPKFPSFLRVRKDAGF